MSSSSSAALTVLPFAGAERAPGLPLRVLRREERDARADLAGEPPRAGRVAWWLRLAARAMVLALGLPLVDGLAARLLDRVFARLPFMSYLAAPSRRFAFATHLLAEMRRKSARGELSRRYLGRWVEVLLDGALHGPAAREAAARRLGRLPPDFLVVSPGAACNLRCGHCYAARGEIPRGTLSLAAVERLAGELRTRCGGSMVLLSGGEPLLWRDRGAGLLELAARQPRTLFIVYTNGTRLDDAVARRMAALGNVLPLLSLEGGEAQTDALRGRGTHAAVLAAMARLRAAGVLFGVSLTARAANAATLADPGFVRALVEGHGASFLWVLEQADLGRADGGGLSAAQREDLQRALDRESDAGRLVVGFLHSPAAHSGCFGAGRFDGFLAIDWNGDVQRCVYLPRRLANVERHLSGGAGLEGLLREPALGEPCPLAPRAA